jgi:hypothetical protein
LTRVHRAQATVDAFVAAGRRGDRAAAATLVSARDPVFFGRAAVWAANLDRIDWSRLTWTVGSQQVLLSDARRAALGPDAWVQPVTVSWALPGQSRIAREEVWLTFVDEPSGHGGRTTRLAGDGDHPVAASPVPVWLQQPVRLHSDGLALVLTGNDDAADWLRRTAAARRAVAERIGVAARDGDAPLVVEIPQSRSAFERTLGVDSGSYAAVAAAAWPMGSVPGAAPIHVVVNPAQSRQLSRLGRDVLLTHEAVHVATRSPISPAPTWLVEGYADQIAYQAYPAGAAPAERTVGRAVRTRGTPGDWPAEADFAPGANDLDLSYDLAWMACRSIATAYGAPALNRFYAAVDSGASLGEAAARIGTTERTLRQRWRADLEALARR